MKKLSGLLWGRKSGIRIPPEKHGEGAMSSWAADDAKSTLIEPPSQVAGIGTIENSPLLAAGPS